MTFSYKGGMDIEESFQSFGNCCMSDEMISFGAPISLSALATTNALGPVNASKGTTATCLGSTAALRVENRLIELLRGRRERTPPGV